MLRRFLEFGVLGIFHSSLQNLQKLRGGLAGRTNDENTIESALVFPIPFSERNFYGIVGPCDVLLLLRRPGNGPLQSRFRCLRFTNSRMAAKCLQPVRFLQTAPGLV